MRQFQAFILAALFVSFAALPAGAVVRPYYQDVKLPTQKVMEYQNIVAPIVATTNRILTTNAGPTSAAVKVISSFTAQPDVPRNLTITPTGTTGDVESCVIAVVGTDYLGRALTENFTFAADASTAQTGNKAFKTVTSITFPANCESGGFNASWIVGVGSKLGLKRCLNVAGDVFKVNFDGANETVGTVAASTSAVSANTYTPTGTMNAAKDVGLYFVQNFASTCQP